MTVEAKHPTAFGKGFYKSWRFSQWADGNQQWWPFAGRSKTIERLIAKDEPDTTRKDWCIVARGDSGDSKYPPIVAGPFANIKVALVAFNLLYNQGERP